MQVKKIIKKTLLSTDRGTLFFYRLRILRERWAQFILSDYKYITREYQKRFGTKINLKNPTGFAEKMQWLKLFYRNDKMPVCSDKYNLRYYLKEYHYEHLLNEAIAILESDQEIDQLNIDRLPNKFVVKATHGSSWNLIVNDKKEIDWNSWKKVFKLWLKLDLSVFGREWNYRKVQPRILIEKFIEHQPLFDYKFAYCSGKLGYIQVTSIKNNQSYIDYFDANWNRYNLKASNAKNADFEIKKPSGFNEMVHISETFSKDFPFVRVDFYNFEDTIILGELTFFPGGGFPFDYSYTKIDHQLGSFLKLPEPNHNLKLYQKIQNH